MPQELATKDACDLLDADHIAVKHLFVEYARLAMAAPAAAAERRPIAQKICAELTVHAQIEEEIFYPALREATDAAELLDEAEAEHQQAKQLIAQIQGLRKADAMQDELVTQLARSVEHHVKEERDHLFPKARSAPGMDLEALGAQAAALFSGEPQLATDDGSVGRQGLVTELLAAQLDADPGGTVYACGPPAMLEAVRALCAERDVPAQLALESGMACGFGACFGCVVPTTDGYLRLCVDGPVLDSDRLESAL